MKIVIRTRYINTFLVGFKSLRIFYPEVVPDLIVQVQQDKDSAVFETAAKLFGFKVVIVPAEDNLQGNYWANMIYRSLQYEEVVSLDDDLIFLKPGFFEYLKRIQKYTDAKVIGTKYQVKDSTEGFLHSHLIYIKNAIITKNDFTTMGEALQKYEGSDTAILSINHEKEIFYMDDMLPYYKDPLFKSYCSCEYYAHIGGVSCAWHAIYNASVHPEDPNPGGPDPLYSNHPDLTLQGPQGNQ